MHAAKAEDYLLSSIWVRCGPEDHFLDLTDRQPTERADHNVLYKLHDCEWSLPYSCTCMLLSEAFVSEELRGRNRAVRSVSLGQRNSTQYCILSSMKQAVISPRRSDSK